MMHLVAQQHIDNILVEVIINQHNICVKTTQVLPNEIMNIPQYVHGAHLLQREADKKILSIWLLSSISPNSSI